MERHRICPLLLQGDHKSTVASAIRDFSEAQNADLIVLTNYSHTFLEKITQEPVVRKMMFKSSKPIMVLPDLEG